MKPNLTIVDINLIGVMYTFKLAVHYFRRQPEDPDRDRCFIFKGSIVGFLDSLASRLIIYLPLCFIHGTDR